MLRNSPTGLCVLFLKRLVAALLLAVKLLLLQQVVVVVWGRGIVVVLVIVILGIRPALSLVSTMHPKYACVRVGCG